MDHFDTDIAMRFSAPSFLGLLGALLVSAVPLAQGETQNETNFLSVRPSLAKDYESLEDIPTEKYFRKSPVSPTYPESCVVRRQICSLLPGVWGAWKA